MFRKKFFTLTIGSKSSILVLHKGKTVINKLLIESLSDVNNSQLLEIFDKSKSVPIYILLDNLEQNYVNKSYPSVNIFDLKSITSRYLNREFESIKKGKRQEEGGVVYNYMTSKNRLMNKWDCMYVSSTFSKEMLEWLDFLLKKTKNYVAGIYMLPIESVSLLKEIYKYQNKLLERKEGKKTRITLLIIQNKVSGIRQVVFMNEKIIFTRLVNYKFEDQNFIVDFQQDIFRTNEYLKRILPNLKLEEIKTINILPRGILEKINQIRDTQINFTNYTPREISQNIGYKQLIPKNSQFDDVLISNVFINSKKILKFTTKKIKLLSIFRYTFSGLLFVNGFLALALMFIALFIQLEQNNNNNKINKSNIIKNIAEKKLEKEKKQIVGSELENDTDNLELLEIDKIIEFGIFDEKMSKNKLKLLGVLSNLEFLNDNNANIINISFRNSFSYTNSFDITSIVINAKINNASGDIERIFKIYDNIMLQAKKIFKESRVSSKGLPKNIDFSKKYYSVNFDLIIKK